MSKAELVTGCSTGIRRAASALGANTKFGDTVVSTVTEHGFDGP
jgi:hypothetical protein